MKKTLRKGIVLLSVLAMVMSMGTAVLAAGVSLPEGEYVSTVHLYKDEACTSLSMGDAAMDGSDITIEENQAAITLHTTEINYLGITGHLSKLKVYDSDGIEYVAQASEETNEDGTTDYIFTVENFPADQVSEGCVIEGAFTVQVSIMPIDATGYLKFTDIVSA